MEREDSGSFSPGLKMKSCFSRPPGPSLKGCPTRSARGPGRLAVSARGGSWLCAHTQASSRLCFPPFRGSAPLPPRARGLWLVRRRGAFPSPHSQG